MEPNPYEAPQSEGPKPRQSGPGGSGWFVIAALALLAVLSIGIAFLATCLATM
jgi:hypothetical protein